MDGFRRSALLGLAALWISVAPSGAQNLLANGELDTDTFDWEWEGGAQDLDWDELDHDGCGDVSGSALAIHDAPEASWIRNAKYCVTGIVPGAHYSLDGFLRFPTAQTTDGSAWIAVSWRESSTHCLAGAVGFEATSSLSSSNPGVWAHRALRSLTAPAGAHSAVVLVALEKFDAGGELRLRFDGIHLVRGHGYLFGDGFESDTTCRWSAVAP